MFIEIFFPVARLGELDFYELNESTSFSFFVLIMFLLCFAAVMSCNFILLTYLGFGSVDSIMSKC